MIGADEGGVLRRVPLPDGGVLVVRATRPGDAALLARLFDGLSGDDRYLRFFSGYRPSAGFLERMEHANEHGARQLLALIEHPGGDVEPVAEAGAWPLANGNGELGISVASEHRGWLGPYLLDALAEAAARVGMPNLEADVLLSNRRMLALLRARGFAVASHDGYASMRMAISTTGATPTWAPADERPRVLVEAPGGRWAAEDAARDWPLQVMACPGPAGRGRRRPCPAVAGRPCPLAAGADVVIIRTPDHADEAALVAAHRAVHPGIALCLQTADDEPQTVHLLDRSAGAPVDAAVDADVRDLARSEAAGAASAADAPPPEAAP